MSDLLRKPRFLISARIEFNAGLLTAAVKLKKIPLVPLTCLPRKLYPKKSNCVSEYVPLRLSSLQ
jgi:hypothetical protein